MKRIKNVFLITLFVVCLLPMFVSASNKVNVYIITQQNCEHCDNLDQYIQEKYSKDKEVAFYKIDIKDEKNKDLIQAISDAFNVEIVGTPTIFVGQVVLEGEQSDGLDETIERYKYNYNDVVGNIIEEHYKDANVIKQDLKINDNSENDNNKDNKTSNLASVSILLGVVILGGVVVLIIKNRNSIIKIKMNKKIGLIATLLVTGLIIVLIVVLSKSDSDVPITQIESIYTLDDHDMYVGDDINIAYNSDDEIDTVMYEGKNGNYIKEDYSYDYNYNCSYPKNCINWLRIGSNEGTYAFSFEYDGDAVKSIKLVSTDTNGYDSYYEQENFYHDQEIDHVISKSCIGQAIHCNTYKTTYKHFVKEGKNYTVELIVNNNNEREANLYSDYEEPSVMYSSLNLLGIRPWSLFKSYDVNPYAKIYSFNLINGYKLGMGPFVFHGRILAKYDTKGKLMNYYYDKDKHFVSYDNGINNYLSTLQHKNNELYFIRYDKLDNTRTFYNYNMNGEKIDKVTVYEAETINDKEKFNKLYDELNEQNKKIIVSNPIQEFQKIINSNMK